MSDTREASCEERISDQLDGVIASLHAIHEAIDNDGGVIDGEEVDGEDAYEKLHEFPLSIDVKHTMVVQLSWGGPSDQFEIELVHGEHGMELADNAATYRFLDWFDGATRRTDDPDVMRYLEWLTELVDASMAR